MSETLLTFLCDRLKSARKDKQQSIDYELFAFLADCRGNVSSAWASDFQQQTQGKVSLRFSAAQRQALDAEIKELMKENELTEAPWESVPPLSSILVRREVKPLGASLETRRYTAFSDRQFDRFGDPINT
jgi:hypothetical protein